MMVWRLHLKPYLLEVHVETLQMKYDVWNWLQNIPVEKEVGGNRKEKRLAMHWSLMQLGIGSVGFTVVFSLPLYIFVNILHLKLSFLLPQSLSSLCPSLSSFPETSSAPCCLFCPMPTQSPQPPATHPTFMEVSATAFWVKPADLASLQHPTRSHSGNTAFLVLLGHHTPLAFPTLHPRSWPYSLPGPEISPPGSQSWLMLTVAVTTRPPLPA